MAKSIDDQGGEPEDVAGPTETPAADDGFAAQMMEDGVPPEIVNPPSASQPDDRPSDGDPEPEGDGDGDPKPDAGDDEKPAKLTPAQQKTFDERLGKEVGKRKQAEEKLLEAQERTTQLEAEVTELKSKLTGTPTAARGVSKAFLANTDDEIDQREDYLQEVIDFCEETNGEDVIDEKTGEVSYTADQVAARLKAARRELRDIPRARRVLSERLKHNAEAIEVYPAMADKTSDDYREYEQILKRYPSLRESVDGLMAIGDMIAGHRLRTGAKRDGKTPIKRPAAAAAAPVPTPSRRGPADHRTDKKKSIDERFAEGGYSDDALAEAMDD